MPSLTVKRPSGLAVLFPFAADSVRVRIGRGLENDLVVKDPAVSRCHAELRHENGRWLLVHLGGRNGTLLEGRPVDDPALLTTGSEIVLGKTVLVFDADDDGSDAANAATTRHATTRNAPSRQGPPVLVGESPPMQRLRRAIEKVAPSPVSVLITGETGTGKELVARLLHRRSPRAAGPFVAVNCPALPESLLEAELFGVERGAATDVAPRIGRFEAAQGGTLLLDEIGDMPETAQAKVLRVLEEKQLDRVGGSCSVSLDVRVLAATNHDLIVDMESGHFRRDLFHRLNTVVLDLPPLRERRDDVPLLVEHFLRSGGGPALQVSPEAMSFLQSCDYPGNVRELKHLVERARLFAEGEVLELRDFEAATHLGAGPAALSGSEAATDPASLLERIVSGEGSFWDLVREPFLRRELSREDASRVVELAHARARGTYKDVAQLLGVEDQYKKLVNFLRLHRLRVEDGRDKAGEPAS